MEKSTEFKIGNYLVRPTTFRMYSPKGEVIVGKRLMALLICLAKRQGEIVTKETLLTIVWQEVMVSDEALRKSVSDLRHLFGNSGMHLEIESIRGIGYRLKTPVHWQGNKSVQPKKRWLWTGVAATLLVLSFLINNAATTPQKSGIGALFANLSAVRSPRVSADNSKLVYAASHNGESHLYLYQKNKGTHELIEKSGLDRAEAAFSPDGRQIAYVARQNGKKYLFQKDLQTGDKKILTSLNGTTVQSFLDWSPNGQKIAFSQTTSDGDFHIFFVDQTGILTELEMDDLQLKGGNIYPRFSPSGQQLAFIHINKCSPFFKQLIQGQGLVCIKNLETGKEEILTENETEIGGIEWVSEHKLAYIERKGFYFYLLLKDLLNPKIDTLYKSEKTLRHIEFRDGQLLVEAWEVPYNMMNYNTKNKYQKNAEMVFESNQRIWHPSFSPDGEKMVYATLTNYYFSLKLFDFKRGYATEIAQSAAPLMNPRWSTKGDKIIFTENNSEAKIFMLDIKSGSQYLLANGYFPVFDKTGDSFYYCNKIEGKWQVFHQNNSIENTPEKINHFSTWRAEPYKSEFIFSKQNEAGIWQFNPATGEEKLLIEEMDKWDVANWMVVGDEIIYWQRGENDSPIWMAYNLKTEQRRHLFSHRGFINYEYSSFAMDGANGNIIYPQQLAFENEIIQVDVP